jgi:PAS domain S-box-containing protein
MDAERSDFSALFEALPIGAYRSRPDGTMLRANPALVRLNGYQDEAELLRAVRDIAREWYVDPGRRAEFMRRLDGDGRVTAFVSEVWRHKTRERIWITENAAVVRDAAGQVLCYEGTVEEITERVLTERALQRSEARLQQLMSLMPGVVYRLAIHDDGSRHYTFVSDGVRELYGVEPAEVLADGDALVRRRHPSEHSRQLDLNVAALRERHDLQYEVRVRLDDGREKWVQVISAPGPPEDGHPVRVGMLFDVTARKQAEQALRENGELWKAALESLSDGVWDWDIEHGTGMVSVQGKALFGYSDDELAGDPASMDTITHPEDRPAMQVARAAHFEGRTPAYFNEHRVRCKDGRWKWVLSRGVVMRRDAAGRPLRMIGTYTDIDADKQAEALRRERDRAAAADQAKSLLLSRVSHELRTPLNAILGFAQLLELDAPPAADSPEAGRPAQDRYRFVPHILASGRHLLGLVDDLLDLSAAQMGQLRLEIEPVDVRSLAEEVLGMFASTAAQAGVEVQSAMHEPAPPPLAGDRKRCKQILSNLLSNAIKFNRRGGWVRVSAAALPGGQVELSVQDDGPGLTAEQQARLFQPFERAGAERGPVPGSGLGLALSRQFAEAMGGRVDVRSQPGVGSVFTVILPAAAGAAAPSAART